MFFFREDSLSIASTFIVRKRGSIVLNWDHKGKEREGKEGGCNRPLYII